MKPNRMHIWTVALAALLVAGCHRGPNPNLSLESLDNVRIAMSRTVDGEAPSTENTRPLHIKGTYHTVLFGLFEPKPFELAPLLKAELGTDTKITNLRIRTYSSPVQGAIKYGTCSVYEPRTVEVTGLIHYEPPAKAPSIQNGRVAHKAAKERDRRQRALLIGVSDYSDLSFVPYSAQDAKRLGDLLENQYGFAEVKVLTDRHASRERILESMRELARKSEKGDDVLIFYSGHSYFSNTLQRGYWIPADADEEIDYIPHSEIHDVVKALNAHGAAHVLVIADSLFSPAFVDGATTPRVELELPFPGAHIEAADAIRRIESLASRGILSSGLFRRGAESERSSHSVFTQYLLQALAEPSKSVFTVQELTARIQELSGRPDRSARYSSLRNVGDMSGSFVFIRKPDGPGEG